MTTCNIIRRFKKSVEDPPKYLQEIKIKKSLQMVGWACSDTPIILIHSFGFHPFRFFSQLGDLQNANAYLPSSICFLARSILDQALSGTYDFASGVVFPVDSCDVLLGISKIWKKYINRHFVIEFTTPLYSKMKGLRDYYKEELKILSKKLEKYSDFTFSKESLSKSIKEYNRNRGFINRLLRIRNHISCVELLTIINSSHIMPIEEHSNLLEDLLIELENTNNLEKSGPKIVLVGGVLDRLDIIDWIEKCGATIVDDTLLSGNSQYLQKVPERGDPFDAITKSQLDIISSVMPNERNTSRSHELVQMVKDSNANGVIFLHEDICDWYGFEYAQFKYGLDKALVPNLHIPSDPQSSYTSQAKVRVEAFIEMLGEAL